MKNSMGVIGVDGYLEVPSRDKGLFAAAERAGFLDALQNEYSHTGYTCPYCTQKIPLDERTDSDVVRAREDDTFERTCDQCGGHFKLHVFVRKHFISAKAGP